MDELPEDAKERWWSDIHPYVRWLAGITAVIFIYTLPGVPEFLKENESLIEAASTAVVALFTFFLWQSTDRLWQASRGQARDLERSISQAARTATALEVQTRNAERTIRAYLTIKFGDSGFQERQKDGSVWSFGTTAQLSNAGKTPARNVRFRTACAILPMAPPPGADPPYPDDLAPTAAIGPGNHLNLETVLPVNVAWEEVEDIKSNRGRALYHWGEVRYEDVFGVERFVHYRYAALWKADGNKAARFTATYNDAD